MKHNILKTLCALGLFGALCVSCENGDASFPDYEEGTTVYFPYQYPVRTIVLGDDEYDTTLDKNHQCEIRATFGGSYNGSNGSVQVAVDESLVNNLTFSDGSPVKAMPTSYYQLSTNNLAFGGTFYGITTVQLTDAFFADPDAIKATYVIPVVMNSQSGFQRILSGTLKEGASPIRTDASQWEVLPMDYVLYCVKFQNKYTGFWLTNGNTSIDNIEKAGTVEIKTRSLNSSIYTVSYQRRYETRQADGSSKWEDRMLSVDLLLTFDSSDKCTITSLTDGYQASGSGSFTDNGATKSWGNKDRDLIELNYTIDFGLDDFGNHIEGAAAHEKLVWQRSGVTTEEFTPIYQK